MRKILLLGIAIMTLVTVEGDATAALHPHTANIIKAIKNAPDAYQVQEVLCGQGGVLREKGLSAGEKCRIPAFALVFTVGCSTYPGEEDSKCSKNAKQALSKDLSKNRMPVDAVEALTKAVKTQGTNAEAILCSSPREKLPGKLKMVADEACGTSMNVERLSVLQAPSVSQPKIVKSPPSGRAFHLLIPSQAKMIEDLEKDKVFLEKLQKPLERMPKEILARSARDVNKDLRDILQKISAYINQTKSVEILSRNEEIEGQGLLLQSDPFIKKIETMGIRLNPVTGNVEKLIQRWEVVR
jgi:hypothetical protein